MSSQTCSIFFYFFFQLGTSAPELIFLNGLKFITKWFPVSRVLETLQLQFILLANNVSVDLFTLASSLLYWCKRKAPPAPPLHVVCVQLSKVAKLATCMKQCTQYSRSFLVMVLLLRILIYCLESGSMVA